MAGGVLSGSGTALDPYIVEDVDDLQAIGGSYDEKRYSRPWDDNFGEAAQSGTWAVYPIDGELVTQLYWDKVDEATSDGDSTYIQSQSEGAYCLLAYEGMPLSLPATATGISVAIKANCRNTSSGTSNIQGMVKEGGTGTEYMIGSNTSVTSQTYATRTWTMSNPPWNPTLPWTTADVYALTGCGVGVKVSFQWPNIRITQLYIEVTYNDITYSLDAYYELANGIDAFSANFAPLGTITNPFTGSLDGMGYEVTGLTITISTTGTPVSGGFIIRNDGIIQNVGFVDCAIDITATTGMVYAGVITRNNWGTIRNCYVTGTISGSGNSGSGSWNDIGGIAAYNDDRGPGVIENCYTILTVTSTHNQHATAGGIVAWNWGTIEESYALGTATATSSSGTRTVMAGGLVAGNGYAGDTDGIINNSYARGNASASGGATALAGGLVADNQHVDSVITNSFSTGIPTGDTTGGLCASNSGTITNSFWDTETSGQATSDGGTGKTTAEMKAILTFLAWDIAATATNRNDGYAFLSWEIGESATVWLIYDSALGDTTCYTIPDCYDHKGRVAKGARVRAYRVDNHSLINEGVLDEHGTATICGLPVNTDVMFMITWGGISQAHKTRWFFRHIEHVAEGGTTASTAPVARTNLGLAVGTNVQAYDAGLTDISGLATADGNMIAGDGANWTAESGQAIRDSMDADKSIMVWNLILGG